mmetsp:Transcript_81616/g.227108  ORF Transcript_81616/g.227108 Transcript_81616/m.227108 type:complete len:425 (-) Transcript_81616:111-1385(-)
MLRRPASGCRWLPLLAFCLLRPSAGVRQGSFGEPGDDTIAEVSARRRQSPACMAESRDGKIAVALHVFRSELDDLPQIGMNAQVARKDGGLVDAFTALHARTQPFEHVRIKEDIKRICEDPDEALLFVTTTAYDVLRHIILAHSLEDSSCSGSFGEERYTISYRCLVSSMGQVRVKRESPSGTVFFFWDIAAQWLPSAGLGDNGTRDVWHCNMPTVRKALFEAWSTIMAIRPAEETNLMMRIVTELVEGSEPSSLRRRVERVMYLDEEPVDDRLARGLQSIVEEEEEDPEEASREPPEGRVEDDLGELLSDRLRLESEGHRHGASQEQLREQSEEHSEEEEEERREGTPELNPETPRDTHHPEQLPEDSEEQHWELPEEPEEQHWEASVAQDEDEDEDEDKDEDEDEDAAEEEDAKPAAKRAKK